MPGRTSSPTAAGVVIPFGYAISPATASRQLDGAPAPAPDILRTLAAQDGRSMSADELAAALGKKPSGGHWNSGIAILRNNGLIEADPVSGAGRQYRLASLLRS